MITKEITIKQLKKGMILSSGAELMNDPQTGLDVPTGKLRVKIKYPNNNEDVKDWGRNTKVRIIIRY